MPVCFFTYHGRATWMPDHRRGYVHPKRGLQPRDERMAAAYRANQRNPTVRFASDPRRRLVELARQAGAFIDVTVHAVTCDRTYAHVLASWRHGRTPESIRRSIRTALSRGLNQAFGWRDWFAERPSIRRVRNHEHFDFLVLVYAPEHDGVCWVDETTRRRCLVRDAKRAVSVTERRRRRRKRGESKPR